MVGLPDELLGPVEEVIADLRKKWSEMNQHEPFLDGVKAFYHAVDWKEPWIAALVSFQLMLVVIVIATRKSQVKQAVVFAFAAGSIYLGNHINALAASHWQRFSKQPYFDERGVFYSVVVSAPLLLDMFIILINYLIEASRMLIKLKRTELRHRAKELAKAQAEADAVPGSEPALDKKDK